MSTNVGHFVLCKNATNPDTTPLTLSDSSSSRELKIYEIEFAVLVIGNDPNWVIRFGKLCVINAYYKFLILKIDVFKFY